MERAKADLLRLNEHDLVFGETAQQIAKVAKVIKEHGRISRRDLCPRVRGLKPADLNAALRMLLDGGEVIPDKGPKGGEVFVWAKTIC